MTRFSIAKKASLGIALAAGITLAGLPGLASADGGKAVADQKDPAITTPVHHEAHDLEHVQFSYTKIDY